MTICSFNDCTNFVFGLDLALEDGRLIKIDLFYLFFINKLRFFVFFFCKLWALCFLR